MLRKSDAAKLRVTIKFTVEVSEWEDAGAQDITM